MFIIHRHSLFPWSSVQWPIMLCEVKRFNYLRRRAFPESTFPQCGLSFPSKRLLDKQQIVMLHYFNHFIITHLTILLSMLYQCLSISASHLLIQVLLYSHPEVIEYAISIFRFGFLLIFPYDSISRSRRCNCAGGQSPRSLIPAKRDGEPSKAFTMVRVGLHSTQCPHGYGSWEVALFHGNHEKSRLVKYHQNNHGNQWNMVRGRVWHLPWRIGFERLLP